MKLNFDKRAALAIGIIAVLVGLLILNFLIKKAPPSDGFSGVLLEIEGSYLSVEGAYMMGERPVDPAINKVDVKVTPETKFLKNIWHVPAPKESGESSPWTPDDLKTEILVGSLEDLNKSVGGSIKIKSVGDIGGKDSFEADTIEYLRIVNL